MKRVLQIYWKLTQRSQIYLLIAFSLFGTIVPQIILTTEAYTHSYLTIRSLNYCSYFLFLIFLISYGFLTAYGRDITPCLLQMKNAKEIYTKGIIVNNIIVALVYMVMSSLVMGVLILLNGFYVNVFVATLWCTSYSCIWGTLVNVSNINHKKIMTLVLTLLYLGCFFVLSMFIESTTQSSIILHFITQPQSIFVLIPCSTVGFVLCYFYGLYCYHTRQERHYKHRKSM